MTQVNIRFTKLLYKNTKIYVVLTICLVPFLSLHAGSIDGRIIVGLYPGEYAEVEFCGDLGCYYAYTDEDGDYSIEDIPEGTYRVIIRGKGFGEFTLPDMVRVRANAETHQDLFVGR